MACCKAKFHLEFVCKIDYEIRQCTGLEKTSDSSYPTAVFQSDVACDAETPIHLFSGCCILSLEPVSLSGTVCMSKRASLVFFCFLFIGRDRFRMKHNVDLRARSS